MEESQESHPIENLREDQDYNSIDTPETTTSPPKLSTYFDEKVAIPRSDGVSILMISNEICWRYVTFAELHKFNL